MKQQSLLIAMAAASLLIAACTPNTNGLTADQEYRLDAAHEQLNGAMLEGYEPGIQAAQANLELVEYATLAGSQLMGKMDSAPNFTQLPTTRL